MSLQCPSKNQPENGKFADVRGTLHKSAEHKEKPANPDKSRAYELLGSGAGGRTRTGTVSLPTDFEFYRLRGNEWTVIPYGGP